MGILESILGGIKGELHFFLFVGDEPAAEIKIISPKEILIDVKNPILAIELGARELIKGGKADEKLFSEIKKMGFRIKLKYRRLEIEI
jgi:hypothetical protein